MAIGAVAEDGHRVLNRRTGSDDGVAGPDRLGTAAHGLDVRAIGHQIDRTDTNGGECEAFHRSLLVRV